MKLMYLDYVVEKHIISEKSSLRIFIKFKSCEKQLCDIYVNFLRKECVKSFTLSFIV